MLEVIHDNTNFLSKLDDANTTRIAYKFNETMKSVSIISTKSSDGIFAKIKYHLTKIFGRYQSMDLEIHREIRASKLNLVALETIKETTKKVHALRQQVLGLSNEKQKLEVQVAGALATMEQTKAEEKKAHEVVETSQLKVSQAASDVQQLSTRSEELKAQNRDLQDIKTTLEDTVAALKDEISSLDSEHWEKLKGYLVGESPIKYLRFLQKRMKALEGKYQFDRISYFNDRSEWQSYSFEQSQINVHLEYARTIYRRINQGVNTEDKKRAIINEIESLKMFPNLPDYEARKDKIEGLKEYLELSYRFHKINHTNNI